MLDCIIMEQSVINIYLNMYIQHLVLMDKSDSLAVFQKLKVMLRSALIGDGRTYQYLIGVVRRQELLAIHLAMVLV